MNARNSALPNKLIAGLRANKADTHFKNVAKQALLLLSLMMAVFFIFSLFGRAKNT
jgi:hypothetical protein